MKYVLITGAGAGMGLATARAAAESGYFVFALDKTPPPEEKNIMPIQADVTNIESIEKAAKTVSSITDTLYSIVHFAGIYSLNSLIEIDEKDFTKIYDINLFGVYRVNKAFHSMLKSGSGIIITTSELAPLDPLPFTGIYALTKSALDKYAYSLRMELQLNGIWVSVLRPGAVSTEMLGASTTALDHFCNETKIYSCNAKRFKGIVDSVEAKSIPTERIAKLALKILSSKRHRYVYSINRNPLLLLLNILPASWQTRIIKTILR
jgi:NAD(P)-dependent dehydrogenase (short-subunit alcohol dehydrogenase family)